MLGDEQRLVAECEAEAQQHRVRAAFVEPQLAAAIAIQPITIAPQRPAEIQPTPTKPVATHNQNSGVFADVLDRWIADVEEDRPYIVVDRSRYLVAGVKATKDLDDARIQLRLAALHDRQQGDIALIRDQLRARPTCLSFEKVEERRRYTMSGVDPELAKAFSRYQDHDEVADAIRAILNPDPAVRTGLAHAAGHGRPITSDQRTSGPRPSAPVVVVAARAEPKLTPSPAAAVTPTTMPAVAPVVAVPDAVPTSLPVAPPVATTASVTASAEPVRQPVVAAAPEPDQIVRSLIATGVPLTIVDDHFVDRDALRAAKVDENFIEAVRRDHLLVVRAAQQIDDVLALIRAHATAHPGDLVRREGRFVMRGQSPADLVAMARFHEQAPQVRQKLALLYDRLNPPVPAASALSTSIRDMRPLIERHPERFSTIEPDDALREEAKAYAHEKEVKQQAAKKAQEHEDLAKAKRAALQAAEAAKVGSDPNILHGEAARRAASHAAVAKQRLP